ncbi:MAG: hypothetical protein ACRDIB_13470 [Ardenticatenaceae bacterium]
MSTSTYLDYQTLYELFDPLANRPLRLTPEGCSDWLTHQQAVTLLLGQAVPLAQPVCLRGYMGRQVTDFLWCALTPLICLSQRVVDLLSEPPFTGWSTYPVELYDRDHERLTGYHGLAITGRAGKRDRSQSQVVTKPPPVAGGLERQVYRGLYFQDEAWDRSDLFMVNGFKVVTEAVYQAFKRRKLSNARFTSLTDVELDVYLDKFAT